MSTVTSADGTAIAYERTGQGPAVILVDGALCYRGSGPARALAKALAPDFTVYAYDRRGRGDSGDTAPYAPAREAEDLAALIKEAGGTACVYGISSGAAVAMETAAGGHGITRLALYEPPFTAEGGERAPKLEYGRRLRELLADGRRGDAVGLFLTLVGAPAEAIEFMRTRPTWSLAEAIAPTLAYDDEVLGDGTVPRQVAARITVPTLVMDGAASPEVLRRPARAVAEAVAGARHRSLPDQTHDVAPAALAPVLREFFG